ncbi:MAG: hypothetical protein V2J24_13485 [Pseudomonadales bacterium]|jgi:hypothetical protein|nr:hypothetical protein [Pseudomonadales bacterium]
MRLLVLLALVGAVVWALRRSLREERLARLELVGRWACEEAGVELLLEGSASGGTYEERVRGAAGVSRERGRWRVDGDALEFTTDAGEVSRCELRAFAPGRMGLHGAGRAQRIYERR